MKSVRTRIGDGGRIVLPADYRQALGLNEGDVVFLRLEDQEIRLLTPRRAIECAQKQVEGRNFETRKHLLEYDDVMNRQREEIYGMRRDILSGNRGKTEVLALAEVLVDSLLDRTLPAEKDMSEWDWAELDVGLKDYFGLEPGSLEFAGRTRDEIREELLAELSRRYEAKEKLRGPETMRLHERFVMLQVVDQ